MRPVSSLRGRVGVNIGVWTGDPDVDAASWLAGKPRVGGWWRLPVYLSPDTWTLINSQNTCIARALIPAAWFVTQRYPGVEYMDRYGDIFAGYFLQAAAGDAIVRIRLTHCPAPAQPPRLTSTTWPRKRPAIMLLEWLLPELRQFVSDAGSVSGRYLSLADYLDTITGNLPARVAWAGKWLPETTASMRAYVRACTSITGGYL